MPPRRKTASPGLPWDKAELAPIVLIKGPETVLADRARQRLISQVREIDPETEITQVDAAAYAPAQLGVLSSPSLFGERRLILIDGAEHMNDAFLTDMLAYLEAPEDECWVIVHHRSGQRGKKLIDAMVKQVPVIACDEIKSDGDKAHFLQQDFRRARRRIEPDAITAIVEAVGSDVAELAAAATQLIADTEGTITMETVRRYYGSRVEASGFAVADAALAGDVPKALALVRHAIETGTSPVPLVAALAMKLRTLAKVAGMQPRGLTARDLGLAPWQVDRARRELRGWRPEGIGQAIIAVAEADEGVKGAAKDPVYAIEKAILAVGRARSGRG